MSNCEIIIKYYDLFCVNNTENTCAISKIKGINLLLYAFIGNNQIDIINIGYENEYKVKERCLWQKDCIHSVHNNNTRTAGG